MAAKTKKLTPKNHPVLDAWVIEANSDQIAEELRRLYSGRSEGSYIGVPYEMWRRYKLFTVSCDLMIKYARETEQRVVCSPVGKPVPYHDERYPDAVDLLIYGDGFTGYIHIYPKL